MLLINAYTAAVYAITLFQIFSEHELLFTFAICCHPSICHLSVCL